MRIIVLWLAIVLIIVPILIVYYVLYQRHINKSLVNGKKRARLIPPYKVMTVLAVIGLLIFVVIAICRVSYGDSGNELEDKYFNAYYDYNLYAPDEMTGYLSIYSIEENVGYKKYETVQGDIRYTYFIREDEYDMYHPSFIIYVEYIGSDDIVSMEYKGLFMDYKDTVICGNGSGGDSKDYFVILGNASIECSFALELKYYDTEFLDEGYENGMVLSDRFVINIPSNYLE